MLKGCDDPYFPLNGRNSFIKLKKDHILGLGNTADLVIVGGRRDPGVEQEIGIGKLWWTSFYIGCIENKDDIHLPHSKRRFCVIDMINSHGISKVNIRYRIRPPTAAAANWDV